MRSFALLAPLLSGVSALYVQELHKSNYSTFVGEKTKKGHPQFVEFTAQWCGHCQALFPKFEEVAQKLDKMQMKTKLYKVDTQNKATEGISGNTGGIPGIAYYDKNGKRTQYEGSREVKDMLSFLLANELDPVQTCTVDGLKGKMQREDAQHFVRARLPKKNSGKLAALKKGMSMLYDDRRTFVQACNIPLTPEEESQLNSTTTNKNSSLNSFSLVSPDALDPSFETLTFPDDMVASKGNVHQFLVDGIYTRVVGEYTAEKYSYLTPKRTPGVEYIVGIAAKGGAYLSDDTKDLWIAEFKRLLDETKKNGGKGSKEVEFLQKKKAMRVAFVIWDGSAEPRKDMMGNGGPTTEDLLVALEVGANRKYVLNKKKKAPEPADTLPFLKELLVEKSITPFYKSEKIPNKGEELDKDGVRFLVGNNFEKVALDPKKDVIVKFYAPWCQHCQAMAPEWGSLAKKVKDEFKISDKVVIAKMDATANDSPEGVTGYPRVVLYPAVKNSFKRRKSYSFKVKDDLKVDKFVEFLLESATSLEGVTPEELEGRAKKNRAKAAKKEKNEL